MAIRLLHPKQPTIIINSPPFLSKTSHRSIALLPCKFSTKMAPKTLMVAFLFFAVVGLAATVGHATPAAAAGGHATPAAAEPADHQGDASEVGNVGGSDDAAPVGSPVSEGTFSPVPTADGAPGPSASKADAAEVSAAAGVAAAVAAAAFF